LGFAITFPQWRLQVTYSNGPLSQQQLPTLEGKKQITNSDARQPPVVRAANLEMLLQLCCQSIG
jgi:hypothetical protein